MSELDVQEFGEVKRLDLEPGDVLVLELHEGVMISREYAERIREALDGVFPDHRVIVVEHGTLGLVRQA